MKLRWLLGLSFVLVLALLALGLFVYITQVRTKPPGALLPPVSAQTPLPADAFDFPLDPERFGPYVPRVSGPLPVDTRFAAQNPGVGSDGKCFANLAGERIPFNQLYHAGEDWFSLDSGGRVTGRPGAGAPVHAVANGVVVWAQALGSDGHVLMLAHNLPDGTQVWSVYWHVADVQVAVGEAVVLGQPIAAIHDRGFNSHLHWEIRTFEDASVLFPADAAGGRGTCNGRRVGVGYTWDDDPERARPEFWGYLPPSEFVRGH